MPLLKTNIFIFFFLTVTTSVSLALVDRYQQVGPDLLTDHWITRTSDNNWINISENELNLFSSNPQAGAIVYQNLPIIEPGSVLFFSAEIKCDKVVPGKRPWNLARLSLVQNNGKNDRWDLLHAIAMLTGTHDWQSYHNFFYITHDTQASRVIAELNHSTGSLQIRNLQLYPVNETQTYLWIREVILFSWGAFFLLLVGSCLFAEKRSVLFRVLLASAFVSIVIGTSLPGYMKESVLHQIESQIDTANPVFRNLAPWDLTKVWHACIFFLLGVALCWMMKKVPFTQIMVIILMMAAGTEIVQLYIDGRTPLVSDFFIDAAGGLAGIALVRLFSTKEQLAIQKQSNY
ncbi:VanZ family protein [Nitrosomonas sp. Nm166]|uniref:VanZ family protein n=1 Tax=Nitrosomonas sp. Nm166 TaxID=1881054 RepID=UPI0008E9753B|nr:VanZ family protein [Nitrosomonas sp. Nm166]SFE64031.1 VanZ like family protein [Nitrosomonas sp. Nm166]